MQYFFENVNTITSLNWDGLATRSGTGGGVLANQDYRICIKQNPGKLKHYIIYKIPRLIYITKEFYIFLHDSSLILGMCSIEYTESVVANGLDAFDLGAVSATTAANAATAQVIDLYQLYDCSESFCTMCHFYSLLC